MVHIIPQTVPICESLEVFSGVHSNTTDQHKDLRPTSARDGIHYTWLKDYLSQHSPWHSIHKGEYMDRLVCISTGIVAPATANADGAIELGELAANQLSGKNYTDVKLKRNDKYPSVLSPMVLKYVGARWRLILFQSSFVSPVSYVDVTK